MSCRTRLRCVLPAEFVLAAAGVKVVCCVNLHKASPHTMVHTEAVHSVGCWLQFPSWSAPAAWLQGKQPPTFLCAGLCSGSFHSSARLPCSRHIRCAHRHSLPPQPLAPPAAYTAPCHAPGTGCPLLVRAAARGMLMQADSCYCAAFAGSPSSEDPDAQHPVLWLAPHITLQAGTAGGHAVPAVACQTSRAGVAAHGGAGGGFMAAAPCCLWLGCRRPPLPALHRLPACASCSPELASGLLHPTPGPCPPVPLQAGPQPVQPHLPRNAHGPGLCHMVKAIGRDGVHTCVPQRSVVMDFQLVSSHRWGEECASLQQSCIAQTPRIVYGHSGRMSCSVCDADLSCSCCIAQSAAYCSPAG